MKKITDIFEQKKFTLSFEFFPPKDKQKTEQLFETISSLKRYDPDFISVTYGAGGGTRGLTLDLCERIQRQFSIPAMAHLTCIGHTRQELKDIIGGIKDRNIRNILALRGDIPKEEKTGKDDLQGCYAYQLCKLIRGMHKDFFSIGVAGFPEGHVDAPDKETDSKYMKIKIDAGGEFVVTQLFFEPELYKEYIQRIRGLGVDVRIIPGILPLTDYKSLTRFCRLCGANIPPGVHNLFTSAESDEQEYKIKVGYTSNFCIEMLKMGAPGLHFYTLNRVEPTSDILNNIQKAQRIY